MKSIIILENIRSAYNVGNIIRTADALGYDVVLSGFSPSPDENESVKKTSLWAEDTVNLKQFRHSQEALDYARAQGCMLVAAEVVEGESVGLDVWVDRCKPPVSSSLHSEETTPFTGGDSSVYESTVVLDDNECSRGGIALIMWNENTGVLKETREQVDHIVHIPMQGKKESLNVGQAAAIMMWEMRK